MQAIHGLVHILHEEGIVEIVETGTEESAGLLEGLHATFDEEFREHLVDPDLRCKAIHLVGRSRIADHPFAFLVHIMQI